MFRSRRHRAQPLPQRERRRSPQAPVGRVDCAANNAYADRCVRDEVGGDTKGAEDSQKGSIPSRVV